jgi:hypothetical protein
MSRSNVEYFQRECQRGSVHAFGNAEEVLCALDVAARFETKLQHVTQARVGCICRNRLANCLHTLR